MHAEPDLPIPFEDIPTPSQFLQQTVVRKLYKKSIKRFCRNEANQLLVPDDDFVLDDVDGRCREILTAVFNIFWERANGFFPDRLDKEGNLARMRCKDYARTHWFALTPSIIPSVKYHEVHQSWTSEKRVGPFLSFAENYILRFLSTRTAYGNELGKRPRAATPMGTTPAAPATDAGPAARTSRPVVHTVVSPKQVTTLNFKVSDTSH